MADGQLFKVDSQFLEAQVLARSYELLKTEGFDGALDELNQARNELAVDNVKGAIHSACKSLESVLKAVTGVESANAGVLIKSLAERGFYEGLPDDVARASGDQVLMGLPFLGNRLGGHGQGPAVVEVPRAYGELAIHLAASFLLFIVHRSIQLKGPSTGQSSVPTGGLPEGDVPF